MSQMKISLSVNLQEIKELMSRFRDSADRAHNSALSRATKKTETEVVNRAYEKINLKKADLRDSVSAYGRGGEITISPSTISLSRFLNVEPKKTKKSKGVAVKLWRDRAKVLYEGSFAAYGANSNFHVFKRVGKSRLPLKKLHGKGVRDMWEVPSFSEGIMELAQEEYSNRFVSSFNAFIKTEGG